MEESKSKRIVLAIELRRMNTVHSASPSFKLLGYRSSAVSYAGIIPKANGFTVLRTVLIEVA
jgi:hypothetical protein